MTAGASPCFHAPEQQPRLVVVGSPDAAPRERTIVDPNAIDRSGRTTVDFFVPSHDGRRVAVSLSRDGTEVARDGRGAFAVACVP